MICMIELVSMEISDNYNFLRTEPHLGENICLLTVGGSHAYGTNVETSDLDIRGISMWSPREILSGNGFEQVEDRNTDTVVYSLNKIIHLLSNCNPNVIEMLGCKKEHYLYLNSIGKKLIDNAHLFLSKKCLYSFGGYASAQLRRLDNKSNRTLEQSDQEEHILRRLQHVKDSFKETYFTFPEDSINLYIDNAVNEEYDTEIFMDINLKHYPLRDYKSMWSEMNNVVKTYAKIGQRNSNAISRGKLGKHMMHLIRLYMMCLDILKDGKIITYREKEHDLLMSIRDGKYLKENNVPTDEFMLMVEYYENELEKASKSTDLPEHVDDKKITDLLIECNRMQLRRYGASV